jgi:hypothetical protein
MHMTPLSDMERDMLTDISSSRHNIAGWMTVQRATEDSSNMQLNPALASKREASSFIVHIGNFSHSSILSLGAGVPVLLARLIQRSPL